MPEPIYIHCADCGLVRGATIGEETTCFACDNSFRMGDGTMIHRALPEAADPVRAMSPAQYAEHAAAWRAEMAAAQRREQVEAHAMPDPDPNWSPEERAAREAAYRAVQERVARGEALTAADILAEFSSHLSGIDEARAASPAPAPRPAAAPSATAPSDPVAGWIQFAVGFAIIAFALPLGTVLVETNETLAAIVMVSLVIGGMVPLYRGLREALGLGGRPVVAGVLAVVALNVCLAAGMGMMSALGIGFAKPAAEAEASTSNVSG